MTLCLCMIVRNEEGVIARALDSIREHLDYWVICDTGSTDATPAVVLSKLIGIPGELHRVPWVNFGHNRADVLARAKGKADYVLMLDADMVALVSAPFKHLLTADAYEIRYTGELDYSQPMLIANRHEWSYVGVTHEYLTAPTATVYAELPQLRLQHLGDGGMRADKFERDALLLREALAKDPNNARDIFYLAQTEKDLGHWEEALSLYQQRALLPGWEEETWYARYMAAQMLLLLGRDWHTVQAAFLDAYAARPSRLEPIYYVVKHYRELEQFHMGYTFAAQAGLGLVYPSDRLFVERPVYEHLFVLEYGACAYGVGRMQQAITAFNEVLVQENLPQWVFGAATRGLELALRDLYGASAELPERPPNPMVIFVPFRNPGPFLEKCIRSLLEQDYEDFRVLLVDDGSSDGSVEACVSSCAIGADPRFIHIRNSHRRGLAQNLAMILPEHCEPDDIVVCLDGDDWLAAADALSHINDCYNRYGCWLLHSQFQYADGSPGFSQPFASPREFAFLRTYFRMSHLRSFRAGLFASLAELDPGFDWLKDEDGKWLHSAVDAALMCSLAEAAGWDRVRFTPKVLYVYNDKNPLSHHALDRAGQERNFEIVKQKRPFARLAGPWSARRSHAVAAR